MASPDTAAQATPTPPGISWPANAKGKVSTTRVAKQVWCAVAKAVGRADIAQAIHEEDDWRFKYDQHLIKLMDVVGYQTPGMTRAAVLCGLKQAREAMLLTTFDGTTMSVEAAAQLPVGTNAAGGFASKIVTGTAAAPPPADVKYKQTSLTGEALAAQLKAWEAGGQTEPDIAPKILAVIPELAKGALKDKWFVLLGAGSEMGPFRFLLEQGANVLAVRTKKQQKWAEMEAFAKTTCGTLHMPESRAQPGTFGCDILSEPLEIRDWVLQTIPAHAKDVTVGIYTYLDGEAHVRISLACDLIMEGVDKTLTAQGVTVRLAYIGSPSTTTGISKAMYDSVPENRSKCAMWMKMTGCPAPQYSALPNGVHLSHQYATLQGPNYALSKNLQNWRAVTASHVSFCNGPSTKTWSVTHNETMKAVLESMHQVVPCEAYEPETSSTMLSLLLAADVLLPQEEFKHPYEATATGSFHGGVLRMGFDVEKSTVLSAALYVSGKYF